MVLSSIGKKGVMLTKVALEYGNERLNQINDDELINLTKDLGKKYINIFDEKANDIMDKTLDKANAKLDDVKNGEDNISKGKEYVKGQIKDAIVYADSKFTSSVEETEVELSLRKKQRQERKELLSKHKEEIIELQIKQSKEQYDALKDKVDDLKVKKDVAEEKLKDRKDEYVKDAKSTKNYVKKTAKDVQQDISDIKDAKKDNKDKKQYFSIYSNY